MTYQEDSSLTSSARQVTGGAEGPGRFRIVAYPFDRYVIYVKLDDSNRFIEITQVAVNKQFLSDKQKLASMSYLDVEEYYRE